MRILPISFACLLLCCCQDDLYAATYRVADMLEVDTVPSWFPVGFCLLTHEDQQYAAYYNEKHEMVVARRGLDQRQWQKATLPTKIGWDSHNYVTMAIDRDGCLHVSGNMHCVPLVYFRSQRPGDITTFERLPMTGVEEHRVTYPMFLEDADGNLLYTYRSGSSGNGARFYNGYDPATKRWTRFLDTPLFDGQGDCNAYPRGPLRGPDGLFHVVWVWRDTPDCATNHHLSYARSRDMKHWETADGTPVTVPLTLDQKPLCVDPVPSGGGIINSGLKFVFDSKNRPLIAYHKRDENGHMQIYLARFEQDAWQCRPITTWEKPVPFGGRGAMPFIGISITAPEQVEPGILSLKYRHGDYGSGRITLDESTLRPIDREVTIPSEYPKELAHRTIDFEGIGVKLAGDIGQPDQPGTKYVLRWETLQPNHDRPRQPPLPPAATLKLIKLEQQ